MMVQERLTEAERRIEEARSTQAESLDLGDLALRALPVSLGDLPHPKALYLGTEAGTLVFDRDRDPSELADLAPLGGLKGLQILNLSGCKSVKDLAPLARLQDLEDLSLWDTGITDLAP